METQTLEHQSSMATDNRPDEHSAQKAKISLPDEVTEQILSRLPVKSILRFKSVSKPWLSLLSSSSFTKLHSTVGPRTTAFFFTIFDSSTNTRYFFSGGNEDGALANLIKLHDSTPYDVRETAEQAEQLNGLIFTSITRQRGIIHAYVLNPTTHRFFKLPDPPVPLPIFPDKPVEDMCYMFGFDESTNEHKVLYFDVDLINATKMELMIFSVSNYSWRKIIVDLPVGMNLARWWCGTNRSVCVNSTIHLIIRNPFNPFKILAFDLRTETFSIVKAPPEVENPNVFAEFVKVNGLLGISSYFPSNEGERRKVHIWILQDYQSRVWVRETITLPHKSKILHDPYPSESVNMDEIIVSSQVLSENLISVAVYNFKTRCFKVIQLTLGHRLLHPKSWSVVLINSYVESLIPLQN